MNFKRMAGQRMLGWALALGATALLCAPLVWGVPPAKDGKEIDLGPHTSPPVMPVLMTKDLRTLPAPLPDQGGQHGIKVLVPEWFPTPNGRTGPMDPVRQKGSPGIAVRALAPSQTQSFDGAGGDDPPDDNGDVGGRYYLQTTNFNVGFYDKFTGTPTSVVNINTFWFNAGAATGTPCDNAHRGDPVALYDQLADRYIVTDFAWGAGAPFFDGPYYECIAISRTNDPIAGGWWLYALRADDATNPYLPDYPKLGVWPDGYYMMADMFDISRPVPPSTQNGEAFQFVRVWALDRASMLTGAALREVHFDRPGYFSMVPSHFKGTPPPAGRPNYFGVTDYLTPPAASTTVHVFRFHADYNTPANSWFGTSNVNANPVNVTVASYVAPSVAPPQLGSAAAVLDTLGPRLLTQFQYRNIAGTESLWGVHTVDAGGGTNGERWYQLNVTGDVIAGAPVQQGTFSPDATHRWMGHLVTDGFGDMALGYSASSSSINPQIRYTGRLAGDAANTLQAEATLFSSNSAFVDCAPTPPATTCGARWGDYSSMEIDPLDDCTFWYTNEYINGGAAVTRIGAFRFGGCTADIQVTKTASPNPVNVGANETFTILVHNNGPVTAQNVVMTDVIAYPFVSIAAPAGWTCVTPAVGATGTVTCSTLSLGSGASATISLVVRAPLTIGTMSNTSSAATFSTDLVAANNAATATAAAVSPSDVSGAKSLYGDPNYYEGATVHYQVVLTNASAFTQFDNPGDEFTDVLPAQLTLVSATASSGTITTGANTVHWNGSIPGGGSVTILITATINAGTMGTTVSNQGTIHYDINGDGTNSGTRLTNVAAFDVLRPVPTLGGTGMLLLLALLAGLGVFTITRRRQRA